jgi:hypothetical protein
MPLRYIFAVLFLMLAPVVYFITTSAQSSVIEEMIAASKQDNAATIASRVNWEALRNFVKDDIKQSKKGSAYFASLGPTETNIGPVVDHYLREENVSLLFYYHEKMFPGTPEDAFIESTGYAPPLGFYLTLAYPKVAPGNPSAEMRGLRDRLKVRFVFRLDGTTWRIKEMHVPLFMVPSQPGALPVIPPAKP